jgi:hypothetical protein
VHGDVELTDYDDDGAYVALRSRIDTPEKNLGKAYDAIRKIADEVEEAAEQAADEVGQRIAEVAARLSGWGAETLDALVDAVERAKSADDKGRTLEELLQQTVCVPSGFVITGRVRTETEEIDISVLNDSADPRLRPQKAQGILAPCRRDAEVRCHWHRNRRRYNPSFVNSFFVMESGLQPGKVFIIIWRRYSLNLFDSSRPFPTKGCERKRKTMLQPLVLIGTWTQANLSDD